MNQVKEVSLHICLSVDFMIAFVGYFDAFYIIFICVLVISSYICIFITNCSVYKVYISDIKAVM